MAESSTSQSVNIGADVFWATLQAGLKGEITRNVPENQLGSIIGNYKLDSKDAKLQAIANVLQHIISNHETTYGPTAKETCSALHTLGMVQFERGDWAASIATYGRLIAASEARNGPNTALAARHNLALTLTKDGQYVEAEGILRKLLPIEKAKIGVNSPQALGCLRILIEVLAEQGKMEEARQLLEDGRALVGGMRDDDPEKMEESRTMSEVETSHWFGKQTRGGVAT